MSLEDLRIEINRIDDEIVGLYLKRMETARAIGAWKRENGVPVYDPDRERRLLDRVAGQAGDEYAANVRALFTLLISQSRALQQQDEGSPCPRDV